MTHGVTASNPKTVLPQTNLRKTRKNPLAWPPRNTAESLPQLQGHPPSRPPLCGLEVSGISSKALTLKSPPLAAINTRSGADRSLHKWFQNVAPPPKGRAPGSRNSDSSLPKPPTHWRSSCRPTLADYGVSIYLKKHGQQSLVRVRMILLPPPYL